MRGAFPASLLLSILVPAAACHWTRYDAKPETPTQMCRACCQQAQDACKLDSDHPGYYCPREYGDCVNACESADENQICVTQTKPRAVAVAIAVAATSGAHDAGPPVAVAKAATPAARGECDTNGTWQLVIADAIGRGAGCSGLADIPRQVSFRIERRHDGYALRDLVPAPGWSDGFVVANQRDECGVTLTRDHAGGATGRRHMSVAMTEKDGAVVGTFHYVEELLAPAACELDAKVTGALVAPAPRPAPPQPAPPRPVPAEPPVQRGGGGPRR